jgi:hypothetical protein
LHPTQMGEARSVAAGGWRSASSSATPTAAPWSWSATGTRLRPPLSAGYCRPSSSTTPTLVALLVARRPESRSGGYFVPIAPTSETALYSGVFSFSRVGVEEALGRRASILPGSAQSAPCTSSRALSFTIATAQQVRVDAEAEPRVRVTELRHDVGRILTAGGEQAEAPK